MKRQKGTYLEGSVMDSRAFTGLRPAAMKVYLGLTRRVRKKQDRRQGWQPTNARELVYPYVDIKREWDIMSSSTIVAAWDELVEKGFVDLMRQGDGKHKQVSIYGLSDRWRKWHPNPTGCGPRHDVSRDSY